MFAFYSNPMVLIYFADDDYISFYGTANLVDPDVSFCFIIPKCESQFCCLAEVKLCSVHIVVCVCAYVQIVLSLNGQFRFRGGSCWRKGKLAQICGHSFLPGMVSRCSRVARLSYMFVLIVQRQHVVSEGGPRNARSTVQCKSGAILWHYISLMDVCWCLVGSVVIVTSRFPRENACIYVNKIEHDVE